jgi:hypothetical protein
MRSRIGVSLVLVLAAACTDTAPTAVSTQEGLLAHRQHHGRSPEFKTRLRAENEIPVSTSISKGRAKLDVRSNGVIESDVKINNKGLEVVRFCHIHVINTATNTGPVVWFLTPTGVTLQIADRKIRFRQDADYVNNAVFGPDTPENDAAALAALLAEPERFYVNCHSNAFPPGFVRGNLPGKDKDHGKHGDDGDDDDDDNDV